MNKRAFIVGCNYPNTPNELHGCVNDANAMEAVLRDHYSFTQIHKILDNNATTANIKAGLNWLVSGAQPGDVLVFHYSGHGSQIPGNEPDGLDEIICPVDLDWQTKMITDNDLREIFDRVPNGVNVTVILDSCHSGTMLDQAQQFQPLGPGVPRTEAAEKGSRYMPPPANIASLMEGRIVKHRVLHEMRGRDVNVTALLISGCQSTQTSADAYVAGNYHGAATYALCDALKRSNYDIDYKTLVTHMDQFMAVNGYTQRPELDGAPVLFGQKFACPFVAQRGLPAVKSNLKTKIHQLLVKVTAKFHPMTLFAIGLIVVLSAITFFTH